MSTSKCAEPSRAQRHTLIAEGPVTFSDPCDTISTSEPHQRELRQPGEALQLENDNQGTPLARAPGVSYKSEQAALIHQAFNHTLGKETEQPIARQDENAQLPMQFSKNASFAYGEQAAHLVGLDAAREVVELSVGQAPITGPVTVTQHWYLRESNRLEMGPDDDDMEADVSIPMDEVKVWPHLSFGPLSNANLDPRFAYQPQPYSQDIEVEQGDIITDNGLEFVEDSAMEDAGEDPRKVTATVTATETTQQPSPNAFVMPGVIYGGPSNVQSYASVQVTPFSSVPVHPFQPTMSSNVYTLNMMATENTGFPQVVPTQDVVSLFVLDGTASSTPTLEVKTLKEQGTTVSSISPTPGLAAGVSRTTNHSSLSPSPPSLSKGSSAQTSLSIHGAIGQYKRDVEDLAVSVSPQPTVVGVQRQGTPLRYVRITLVM